VSNDYNFILTPDSYLKLWEKRLIEFRDERQHDPVIIKSYDSLEFWLATYPEQTVYLSPGVNWVQLPLCNELDDIAIKAKVDASLLSLWIRNNQLHFKTYLERKLKHDIANQFGALIFAKSLFNVGKKLITDTVYDEIWTTIHNNLNDNESLALYDLLNWGEQSIDVDNQHRDPYKLSILYIDDKASKGWSTLFECMFKDVDVIEEETYDYEVYIDKLNTKYKEKFFDFDVIILDLNLTKDEPTNTPVQSRSGYKVLEMIREIDKLIPVIIFTGSEKEINKSGLHDLGIVEFVTKPFPGYHLADIQAKKLIDALDKCKDYKWIHSLWHVFRTFVEPANIPDISNKFMAIMHKLYDKAFNVNTYIDSFIGEHKEIYNNESVVYLDSIMTDIVKHYRNAKNTFLTEMFQKPDKACFGDVVITEECFGTEFWDHREKLLKQLRHLRNEAYPIHGNRPVSDFELLYSIMIVVYEISKVSGVDVSMNKHTKNIVKECEKKNQNPNEFINAVRSLYFI
jgi:CheY-like chemotaxis protein